MSFFKESVVVAFSWLGSQWISVIGFIIILLSFNYLNARYSNIDLSIALIIISFLTICYDRYNTRNKQYLESRLKELKENLGNDCIKYESARETLIASGFYQRKATQNGVSIIIVLVVLSFFVAFANVIVTNDAVDTSNSSKISIALQQAREDFKQAPNSVQEARVKDTSDAYIKSLSQDRNDESAIKNPYYRMFAALLLRISVIAVAIYLVIILNNSYKQNSSVATLYRSRFLGIIRFDGNLEEFAKYCILVSTENIEYRI